MIRFPFSKPRGRDEEPEKPSQGDATPPETREALTGDASVDNGDGRGPEARDQNGADPDDHDRDDHDREGDDREDHDRDGRGPDGPGDEARPHQGAAPPHRFLRQPEEDSDPDADGQGASQDGFARNGAPDMAEQIRMVEAMLFASDRPLSTAELASRMPIGCDAAVAVRKLEEMYEGRGVTLARVAGKWAFRTAADLAWLLAGEAVEQRRLSRAAIETLAIIAYHQPVTRAEIEEIRQVGVSKGTIDLLMELEWVKLGRRRQTPGRPVTFVTTELFLETFGLESTKDLPRLEELRQAGLLESRPPVGFGPGVAGEGDEDMLDEDEEDEDSDERGQADLLI
jgi:segregation and condensation protein B